MGIIIPSGDLWSKLELVIRNAKFVQGDSGGNVSILRSDMGHCKKKVSMDTSLILSGQRDIEFWIYEYYSIVNGNEVTEVTCC